MCCRLIKIETLDNETWYHTNMVWIGIVLHISNIFEGLEAETCGLSKSLTMALLSFADFYVKVKRPLVYQINSITTSYLSHFY